MYEYTVQRYSRQALLLTSIPYRGTGTPTGTAPYELHVHVRASEFNHTRSSTFRYAYPGTWYWCGRASGPAPPFGLRFAPASVLSTGTCISSYR